MGGGGNSLGSYEPVSPRGQGDAQRGQELGPAGAHHRRSQAYTRRRCHKPLTTQLNIRECQASSQLVVAARADKRTPGSPGQGRRTRGSTQRVATTTLCVSVPPEVNPQNMASPFIGPLAMVASILTHPRFRPSSQRRTGAGVPATCRRWGGGETCQLPPRLPSASLVIRDGASSPEVNRGVQMAVPVQIAASAPNYGHRLRESPGAGSLERERPQEHLAASGRSRADALGPLGGAGA